ncbi:MAG: hypothetical protein Q8O03_02545 [Nanoarchaeota archaeon]|nr:hypothetical protein [Nanoarchaeota archaeon]
MLESKESLVERILKEKAGNGLYSKIHDKEWYGTEKNKLLKLDIYILKDMEMKYSYYTK